LKATEICGVAAMLNGYHVRKSEVHGMSQRGGSVESHLRFGEKIYSPLINKGEADILVCFNAAEGKRLDQYLKKDGINFTQYLDDAERIADDKRFMNTACLGVLSSFLPIKQDTWLHALETVFSRAIPENKRIFILGSRLGEGHDLE